MKQEFFIKGLHCKSCEILIENKLNNKKGIKKAEVVLSENKLIIESNKKINLEKLNKWFEGSEYGFYTKPSVANEATSPLKREILNNNWWWLGAILVAGLFILLSKIGWTKFIDIRNEASWWIIILFGIIAGFSSCGALLSGVIISFDKEKHKIIWGRIMAYTIMGGVLGYAGEKLALGGLMNGLMVVVSVVMIAVAMQMLGVKWVNKISFDWNKKLGKKIANGNLAWMVGFLAVLLPCGFTLLVEGSAMLSGSLVKGAMMMLMFALGSSLPLWLISKGIGRIKNQKAVGLLVLFFVFYNLWFWAVPQILGQNPPTLRAPSLENGGQKNDSKVVKLTYGAFGLTPSEVTIKKGKKVRLEIEVEQTVYGCMSTILLPNLFAKPQTLAKGKTLVMEFTPTKVGSYQFVCAMGVPHRGEIIVSE